MEINYTNRVTQYWQSKKTPEVIIEVFEPEDKEWDKTWHLEYRRVRMLHHPESCCVFVEDYHDLCSALDDPCTVELNIPDYKYWKLIYENPDI